MARGIENGSNRKKIEQQVICEKLVLESPGTSLVLSSETTRGEASTVNPMLIQLILLADLSLYACFRRVFKPKNLHVIPFL